MRWSDAYIGIPKANHGHGFDGCDCRGLAKLVYARELGITLPSYREFFASREERAEIDAQALPALDAETAARVLRVTLRPLKWGIESPFKDAMSCRS